MRGLIDPNNDSDSGESLQAEPYNNKNEEQFGPQIMLSNVYPNEALDVLGGGGNIAHVSSKNLDQIREGSIEMANF